MSELTGRIVSHEGHVGGVLINFVLPDEPDKAIVEITDHLNEVLDHAHAINPDIDFHMTGSIVMNRAFADATKDDLLRLSPIVFMVIVAVAVLLLRSVFCTLAIMIMTLFVISTATGYAGWMGTVFSPGNAGMPIVMTSRSPIPPYRSGVLAALGRPDRNEASSRPLESMPIRISDLRQAIGSQLMQRLTPFRSLAFRCVWHFLRLSIPDAVRHYCRCCPCGL